jgi:pyruvate/2-oxoglutarate dehydrogenase complex dihydrolipoamide dehydrogenase (E3) component
MPDALVLATGAEPIQPEIPGIDHQFVISCWDLLRDEIQFEKEQIAVIGGGMIGVETAEYLLGSDNRVTIIEQLSDLAEGMEPNHKRQLLNLFKEKNVNILTKRKAIEIIPKKINLINIDNDASESVDVDRVVIAVGTRPSNILFDELDGLVPDLYIVGDSNKVGFIMDAIYEGSLIGRQI